MWFTFTRVCIIKYPLLPWNWLHRCICFYSYISLWLLPEKRKVIIFSECTSLFRSVIFWSLCSPSMTPHYCWHVDSNTRRWHKLSTWCSHGKWALSNNPTCWISFVRFDSYRLHLCPAAVHVGQLKCNKSIKSGVQNSTLRCQTLRLLFTLSYTQLAFLLFAMCAVKHRGYF